MSVAALAAWPALAAGGIAALAKAGGGASGQDEVKGVAHLVPVHASNSKSADAAVLSTSCCTWYCLDAVRSCINLSS